MNDKEAPAGLVTLSGLLNNIWTLAGLNRWSVNDVPFGWSVVSKKIYNSVKGYTINGIPITQLLWVLPHMNDEKLPQVRDECLNFVKSCNIHGRYALIVAPIGTSEYQNHSMCLRFRSMAKPPIFIDYKRFPIKTLSLKETGKHPYPVAIMLVKAPNDKPYLLATDISMLWMTTNYLPCVTKDRVSTLAKALVTAHELTVPLDVESGKLLPEIATITNTKWTIKALLTDSHGGLPPWLV